MAGRQNRGEDARPADEQVTAKVGAGFPVWLRIALVLLIVGLAAYTTATARRLNLQDSPGGDADLQQSAKRAAERAGAQAEVIRTALTAAADRLEAQPERPLDAAETALRSAGATVTAVAVVDASGVRAVAGRDRAASFSTAVEAAGAKPLWIGARDAEGRAFMVVRTQAARGARLIAATRFTVEDDPPTRSMLVDATGQVLAASELAPAGADVLAAIGVTPTSLLAAAKEGVVIEAAPGDTPSRVAAAPVLDGLMLAVAVRGQGATASAREYFWRLLPLAAPLALGVGLIVMLLIQARTAAADRRTFAASESRFRLAVEAARCGIWEWDLRKDIVLLSDVTGAMLGYGGAARVRGEDVLARIAPDHRETVRQALRSAAAYGAFDVSFRAPRPDGRSAWIDARGQALGQRDAEGFRRLTGVALDVTNERRAQARAQTAENRLRDAIDSLSEGFALWDRRGRLLISNYKFLNAFDLDPAVMKPGAQRDTVMKIAELAIRRENPSPDGRWGVREAELHDGRWLQVSERATAEGGTVMTAVDITPVKRQEEIRRGNEEELQRMVSQLEQSRGELAVLARKYEQEKTRAEAANRAKSEFLANMSHELRTPLNAVNGFSEIMVGEMYGPLGDRRYKEYAQDILNSGQHLLAVINDILDMAKIEAGKLSLKFEPVDLHDVVEDAVRLVRNRAETAGLQLVVDMPNLPDVEADYRAIKQVLLNLLSNAVKFTPRGGTVTVGARSVGDRVQVLVRDTGIGISKEDLERLARPFEQVESQQAKTHQGSGLGLALTKSLVEMHDGAIALESEPGAGTTVSFTLPIQRSVRPGVAAA